MKKIRWGILFCLSFVVLISFTVYAHPGRTDSSGGHNDNSTGEYHYHHGYPAHQHIDGICPYEFDDKTDHNSSKSNSTYISNENNKISNSIDISNNSSTNDFYDNALCILGFMFALGIILFIVCGIIDGKHKNISSEFVYKLANILFWSSIILFFVLVYVDNNSEKDKNSNTIKNAVYVTTSSKYFHTADCSFTQSWKEDIFAIEKAQAIKEGYKICPDCNP